MYAICVLLSLFSMAYGSAWAEEISFEHHASLVEMLQQVEESDENYMASDEVANDVHPELQEQIEQSLLSCRYESSPLESYTPGFFQAPLCEEVLNEALEDGVPLAWLKHFVNGLSVAEETEKRKVYVY